MVEKHTAGFINLNICTFSWKDNQERNNVKEA